MKSITTYIKENLEDNLIWKLSKWFERNEIQKAEFINLIISFKQNKLDIKELEAELQETSIYSNIKEFVNFIIDDLDLTNEKDYLYQFKKIIELTLSNKSKNNKFIIQERLIVNKNTRSKYKYFPENWIQLKDIIRDHIDEFGYECDLNDIDTSKITDMQALFSYTSTQEFNGDISEWDVSNVENMEYMFESSKFNGDLSKWNTSKVKNMRGMFESSQFSGENGNISNWDVSNVENMARMFAYNRNFNQDISKWNTSKVKENVNVFYYSLLDDDPEKQPKFNC